jgi:hypothetical protein
VKKGFSWKDVRAMETWRRKKYSRMNRELDNEASPEMGLGRFL